MKKIFSPWLLAFLCLSQMASSQTTPAEKIPVIYGPCTPDSLRKLPFRSWFNNGYEGYTPGPPVVSALQKIKTDGISIRIFFGSWCGDSKREVPRFLKLLDAISFPAAQISLIGVGSSDSLYKQSPGKEETGMGIYRVPVFIISRNGRELGRINEYPVISLENDLLRLLSNQYYSPNYRSFVLLREWIETGLLTDENSSLRGLAEQLRYLVSGENELGSLSGLLLQQGKKKEALQVARMNFALFQQSAEAAAAVGKCYLENNEYAKARALLEKSLELNHEATWVKEISSVLYKVFAKENGIH